MKKKLKPKPILDSAFSLYPHLDNWPPFEVPNSYYSEMKDFLPRFNDVISIFVSGDQNTTLLMHGIFVVAGMDVLVQEKNPKYNTPHSFDFPGDLLSYYGVVAYISPSCEGNYGGFRIASIPEPSNYILLSISSIIVTISSLRQHKYRVRSKLSSDT